jgi:phosphate transport system permease protein
VCTPFVLEAALERLRSLPQETLDAANALGLSKEILLKRILFPYAFAGALAGLRVSVPRLLGETAPLLFTACVFSGVSLPHGIQNSPVLSLPFHIYILSQESFSESSVRNAWSAALTLLSLGLMSRGGLGIWSQRYERRFAR